MIGVEFKVDSPIALKKAIDTKASVITIEAIGQQQLEYFLLNLSTIEIHTLTIVTDVLSRNCSSNLIGLIKKGLKHLYLQVGDDSYIDRFVEKINFFTSLEVLSIEKVATRVPFSYKRPRIDLSEENTEIKKKCEEIVEKNKKASFFKKETLKNYEKELQEVGLMSSDLNNLNDEQIRFVVEKIVNKEQEYSEFLIFDKELEGNLVFKRLQQLANSWDIFHIVFNKEIEKFKRFLIAIENFDINQRFQKQYSFQRLIDRAIEHQSVEVMKHLIERKADFTRALQDNIIPELEVEETRDSLFLSNFPFGFGISPENTDTSLRTFFLTEEKVFYDGLAWLIYANDLTHFKECTREVTVNFMKPIPNGIFLGFSLLQIAIFYKRTEFFSEFIYPVLFESASKGEFFSLLAQKYPSRQDFKYTEWSIFKIILHRGLYAELQALLPFESGSSITNLIPNSLESLLNGAAESFKQIESGSRLKNDRESILAPYRKCLNCLLQNNISLKTHSEEFSVLRFCIKNHIFSLIASHLSLCQEDLFEKEYYIDKNGKEVEINPLQLAILVFDDYRNNDALAIDSLFDLYEKENKLIEKGKLLALEDMNLFQYSIFHKNTILFNKLITWKQCPINTAFPMSNKAYPGWLPIQVIIIEETRHGDDFLELLLGREDLDVSNRFIEGGLPHSLVGYYPASALFYHGNPVKNQHNYSTYILSKCIKYFFPLIARISDENVRKEILNESLLHAVGFFDIRTGRNYQDEILELLDKGADRNQVVGDGDRIIDIARDKGLLYLFPTSFQNFSKNLFQKHDTARNERKSELGLIAGKTIYVTEGISTAVSLARNTKEQHMYIVIEQIIHGRSTMDIAEFRYYQGRKDKGTAKIKHFEGKIIDNLLTQIQSSMVQPLEGLKCKSWPVKHEDCQRLLDTIKLDVDKEMNYFPLGADSKITSSGSGHNCYTWAREKLFVIDDNNMYAFCKTA